MRSIWLCLPLVGCVSLVRAHVAEQMGCPEDSIEELPEGIESEGESGRALLGAFTGGGMHSNPTQRYRGCGQTWECARGHCDETAHSKSARLARAVDTLMEHSRQALVPDGTAERTKLLTWQLSSPSRGSTECFATSELEYSCSPHWNVASGVSGP
jgi:hypothetical protein